jgi:hypothetical protein
MRSSSVLSRLLVAASAAPAQVHEHAPPAGPAAPATGATGVASLSPELRALFKAEMAGLQGAMLELLPVVAAGDWGGIARVAAKIRAGFVLAQQLSPEQREELDRALPPGFLERDAEFHATAEALEHAAQRKQADLVPFYVYKLTEGCVGCHSRFARERFPAFAPAHEPAPHVH